MSGWGYRDRPPFFGVVEAAANLAHGYGSYTLSLFQTDFPQFFDEEGKPWAPEQMMQLFLQRVNSCILPERWLESWRYACGLYLAHLLTLYLQTYAPSSDSAAQAAGTGALMGVVKSAALGDASVTYDTDTLTKATEDWGSLNATRDGQMLATEARLMGMGGSYVLSI